MKIKVGDKVKVIAGKDKGKTGTVTETLQATDQVIVEGVKVITKHQKNRRIRSQGQIVKKESPIHVSNVMFLEGDTPVRVGYTLEGEGEKAKKVRISRKTSKKL
jgi:large subunit ribosomal protein L24